MYLLWNEISIRVRLAGVWLRFQLICKQRSPLVFTIWRGRYDLHRRFSRCVASARCTLRRFRGGGNFFASTYHTSELSCCHVVAVGRSSYEALGRCRSKAAFGVLWGPLVFRLLNLLVLRRSFVRVLRASCLGVITHPFWLTLLPFFRAAFHSVCIVLILIWVAELQRGESSWRVPFIYSHLEHCNL